jgi:hypothetical protein
MLFVSGVLAVVVDFDGAIAVGAAVTVVVVVGENMIFEARVRMQKRVCQSQRAKSLANNINVLQCAAAACFCRNIRGTLGNAPLLGSNTT